MATTQEQLSAMPWMVGMPAMQEQLPAMAMERMAPMPCGFHPWMVGMPAMQEQLPVYGAMVEAGSVPLPSRTCCMMGSSSLR